MTFRLALATALAAGLMLAPPTANADQTLAQRV